MIICIAQLSHETSGVSQNSCFPLGAGYIGAYLKKEFEKNIDVEIFKRPTDLNRAFDLRKPDILMLSLYMWNHNLTLAYAKEARRLHPDLIIVVGGPDISIDDDSRQIFMEENSYIDAYILFEGEETAHSIVKIILEGGGRDDIRLLKNSFILTHSDEVNINCADHRQTTDKKDRLGVGNKTVGLDKIPSPYLTGLFDKFFIDGEIPLIETNRGCPFSCTFCQQGEDYYQRIVHFSVDRVRLEIDYIAKKISETGADIYALEVADPNFGMYKRDREICVEIRNTQNKYDYPKYVGCSTGKNKADLIISNTDVLKPGTIMLRSAMQSMSENTLEAIKRKNIKLSAYKAIQEEMSSRGLENNADLMLGLPLETLETHTKGIYDLVDLGVKEFACLQTIILKGTTLESDNYRKKYGIQTQFRFVPECIGVYEVLGTTRQINETEEIIVSTNHLSFQDYLECRKLHLLTMIYHNTRLLEIVYRIFDHLDFKKSDVLRHLFYSKHLGLANLINDFLEDTKSEIFEREEIDFIPEESLTHNKIFKHLSIALYKNKEVVLDALKEALQVLLKNEDKTDIYEIINILKTVVISPFGKSESVEFELNSKKLRRILGVSLKFRLSELQKTALKTLNATYTKNEDKISKMAYRLRPANMIMEIENQVEEFSEDLKGPWQDLHR